MRKSSSIEVDYSQVAALEIAIEYKLKKKAIYAKEGDDKANPDEEEYAKHQRISALHNAYNPDIRYGEVKTFTGRVVKKDEYEKEMKLLKNSLSKKSLLPSLSKSALSRSQATIKTIKPNLKGLNPKNTVFLTNHDGSVISVENLSKIL